MRLVRVRPLRSATVERPRLRHGQIELRCSDGFHQLREDAEGKFGFGLGRPCGQDAKACRSRPRATVSSSSADFP